MIKKLSKVGNSTALILNKHFLDALDIDIDTPVDVSTSGRTLIIKPVSASRTPKPRKRARR